MNWKKPTFELVKMDAEVGSYSEDPDPTREPDVGEKDVRRHERFARPHERANRNQGPSGDLYMRGPS